ncbi:MAG: SIMPL domain-containing protein [Candidatus Paceibacterota bacterium]|jgi:hypothetical protein
MDFAKKPFKWLVIAVGLAVIFALVTFGFYQMVKSDNESSQGRTTTLTAEGKVTVIPDIAKISFSIALENVSIEKLTNENNLKMQTVIDYLKSVDIKEKDIKTTNYSLYPVYEEKCFNDHSGFRKCNSELTKYKLDQVIEVTIRDFAKIDTIIGKVAELGVNNVSNLAFSVEDMEKVQNEAKIQAIQKIMERANDISNATKVRFGRIINIAENYNSYAYGKQIGYDTSAYRLESSIAPVSPAPIEAGSKDITATVSITFEIK